MVESIYFLKPAWCDLAGLRPEQGLQPVTRATALRRWFVTGGDPALRRRVPDLKIRVVNVVDLTSLQPPTEQPHGISEKHYDSLFTADRPIIFNYHGYPWPIQRLVYRRTNQNLRVRGYKEEDTTTTPFGMCVLNQIDRFNLAIDVIDRVPRSEERRVGKE